MNVKKITLLSFVVATALNANEATTLNEITIVEKSNSKLIKDINSEELKSADLAEALTKNSANISVVRRNGIANDQKYMELVQIEWIHQLLMWLQIILKV